jgi:hypothetical protein
MSRMAPDIVMWFYRFLSDYGDEAERDVFCQTEINLGIHLFGGLLHFNYRHSARHRERGLGRC